LTIVAIDSEAAVQVVGPARISPPYPSLSRAAYSLLLLILAMWIARFDRVIFSLTTQSIKSALEMSDTQLGSLSGLAWGAAYGLAAFPLGILIDRKDRTRLILGAVIAWSSFAFLTGFCTSYWEMFLCRAGAGMAEAALFPASFSLICDLFTPRQRRLANIVYLGGSFLGASIGFAAGGLAVGWIARSSTALPFGLAGMAVWRLAFFATIIPSAVLAILFLSASEPSRQSPPGLPIEVAKRISLGRYLRENRLTVGCLFFGLVAVGLGSDEIIVWMPSVLARSYGWSSTRSGEWIGLVFLIGSLGGIMLGGGLTRMFDSRWGASAPLQTLRIGAAVAALSLVALIFVNSAPQLLLVATIHITFAFVGFGAGPGLLMSIAPNHLRGRLYGMQSIVGTVAGVGTPLLVGAFSDHVFHSEDGLRLAICAVMIPTAGLTLLSLAIVSGALARTLKAVAAE
jgi:MFS family permease